MTPAKLAPDLGSQGHLRRQNIIITSCLRLISISDHFIRPYKTYKKCLSHWYAVSRAYGCTLVPLHRPNWPQIWGFCPLWTVKKVPLRHGWGWYPPQTASHILIKHLQSVWAIGMLSQRHIVAPLYRYTGKVGPRFGKSGSLVEWKWCHNVMVEADVHRTLFHTSILNIYEVFKPLVCCLKGVWVQPYTVTPAKLPPDLGSQGHLWSENNATTSWLRLISTSDHFIHPY